MFTDDPVNGHLRHFLGVTGPPATPPHPGRSTASLVCDCLFLQLAGLFHSKLSISWGLPTIHPLWTRLVGDGRLVTELEVDLSRIGNSLIEFTPFMRVVTVTSFQ